MSSCLKNIYLMSSCLKKHVHHVFMSKKHVHHVFMSKNMYLMSKYDICISNAQYSSLSAQQNIWCEILEF